jgi:hypothetical protein
MLVDVASDLSQFRFRLVGTLVTQYFLKEGTGKTVEEVFADRDPSVAKTISALFRRSAREQAVLHTFGSALWLGPGFEEFEAIYLPLSDDGASVNMILHAFVFDRERVMMAREIARSNGGQLRPFHPRNKLCLRDAGVRKTTELSIGRLGYFWNGHHPGKQKPRTFTPGVHVRLLTRTEPLAPQRAAYQFKA